MNFDGVCVDTAVQSGQMSTMGLRITPTQELHATIVHTGRHLRGYWKFPFPSTAMTRLHAEHAEEKISHAASFKYMI